MDPILVIEGSLVLSTIYDPKFVIEGAVANLSLNA